MACKGALYIYKYIYIYIHSAFGGRHPVFWGGGKTSYLHELDYEFKVLKPTAASCA